MAIGLDDVVAAETVLSDVDGVNGRLTVAGHNLSDLAGKMSYEAAVGLLWNEPSLPARLGEAREMAWERLRGSLPRVSALPPFDGLRALLAELPDDTSVDTAQLLLATPAVALPALLRLRQHEEPIAPDARLGQSADVLRMLNGGVDATKAAALDAYLVTILDHGLNASTFAARVVASTQAGLTSAVVSAMGALKGPLHGGAPGPVLDMLDAVGTPDNAERVLTEMLDRGERLMGFGHRVYVVRDPRADALKLALSKLPKSPRLDLALATEAVALRLLKTRKPDRPLDTNVEFFTALLLDALGFPREAFSAVFAMGRVGGWIAHAREQARSGRLIRPRSVYVGPMPDVAA